MTAHYREAYAAHRRGKVLLLAGLAAGLLVLGVLAVQAGSAELSTWEVLRTLAGAGDDAAATIVWNIRLPRILAAMVGGLALAVSGAVMQAVLRNPLASPFTLGISQGAGFGAAIAIVGLGGSAAAGQAREAWSVTGLAFVGAMAATVVVLGIARVRGTTPETMVLAGVALGSLFSAGTVLLQYFADATQVAAIVFWTFGDLGRASWRDLAVMAAATLAGSAHVTWHRWDYNALEAGAESARGLGVDVDRIRLVGMFVASFLTAAVVAFVGIIGFIGLVGPHLVRRVVGNDHRLLLPASALAGALLLLAADTLGRTLIAPVVLPVGAITSFLGAPLFIHLLVTRRRAL